MKNKMDLNPAAAVQKLSLDEDALLIQVPFAMSISGPSQSKNLYVQTMHSKGLEIRNKNFPTIF